MNYGNYKYGMNSAVICLCLVKIKNWKSFAVGLLVGWLNVWLKGRINSWQCGTKKWLPPFCQELLFDAQYEFGDSNWRHENLNQQMGFVTRFMNGAPLEIKVKINESRLLKFYKENSTERKFNREFCGKES